MSIAPRVGSLAARRAACRVTRRPTLAVKEKAREELLDGFNALELEIEIELSGSVGKKALRRKAALVSELLLMRAALESDD